MVEALGEWRGDGAGCGGGDEAGGCRRVVGMLTMISNHGDNATTVVTPLISMPQA